MFHRSKPPLHTQGLQAASSGATSPAVASQAVNIPSLPQAFPGLPRPSPKSQSLSRSYGSTLSTSLIHIVLSTRGYSPWRPAAVMSTAWWENCPFPSIFKGQPQRTGYRENYDTFPAVYPYLRVNRFQGYSIRYEGTQLPKPFAPTVKKKRELFPGLWLTSRSSFALPQQSIPSQVEEY